MSRWRRRPNATRSRSRSWRLLAPRPEQTPREQHVGYHLVAEGRKPFARELGCRFKFRDRWRGFITDHPHAFFFGGLVLFTGLLVALAVVLAASAGASLWLLALVGLATLLPASDVAVMLVNYLVCRILPPRVLPKLNFASGIPDRLPHSRRNSRHADEAGERRGALRAAGTALPRKPRPATAVRAPHRLGGRADGNGAERRRTREGRDRRHSEAERTPRPRRLAAVLPVPPQAAVQPVRRRVDGLGAERGKLEEFNRLLRGATDTSYVVRTGDASKLEVRFVLTLDADTVLPRDAARRLIATLAHPAQPSGAVGRRAARSWRGTACSSRA